MSDSSTAKPSDANAAKESKPAAKPELSAGTSTAIVDDRPKFRSINLPSIGGHRIRRMQPEQIFRQLSLFKDAGIKPTAFEVNEETRVHIQQFVQRCLVPPDTNRLAFPGSIGVKRLGILLSDQQLLSVAKQVAEFLEL